MTEEFQELRRAVQAFVIENPGARAIQIGQALCCSEAEALAALSKPVFLLPATALSDVLAEIGSWERVLVLVRNSDAVAEMTVPTEGWYVKGEWLNWIDEAYNLHIRLAATERILALVRPSKNGTTHSFNLVNRQGQVFCRFYTRTSSAAARLLAFCRSYGQEIS